MVPILVFLTFAAFILGSMMLASRKRKEELATATLAPASDLFFHPGHTWARRGPQGLLEVGPSELAANFAGVLEDIVMPEPGRTLQQGDPVWTMVAKNGRRFTQVMPVAGRVVEVNASVARRPDLTQESPYTLGWLLKVRPSAFGSGLDGLFHGTEAQEWLDACRTRVASSLSGMVGAVAHDGGLWVKAYGDLLDREQWEELRSELFPAE
jgi:glycine cleavage system H lipoate-binding protein